MDRQSFSLNGGHAKRSNHALQTARRTKERGEERNEQESGDRLTQKKSAAVSARKPVEEGKHARGTREKGHKRGEKKL